MSESTTLATLGDLEPSQVAIISQHVAPGLTEPELGYFLSVCAAKGFDPFSRQIYAIKRGGKLTIQTGIDGFRAAAHRTNAWAGMDRVEWSGEGPDLTCHVTVYRMVEGQRCPFPATATLREYKGRTPLWEKMPRTMLEKCCEAKALRRGFSKALSGIYSFSEMDQAQPEDYATRAQHAQAKADDWQTKHDHLRDRAVENHRAQVTEIQALKAKIEALTGEQNTTAADSDQAGAV